MKLRWFFPMAIYAKGPSLEALSLEGNFKHEDFSVKFRLLGEKSAPLATPEKEKIYYSQIRSICFEVEDNKIGTFEESDYPRLFKFLISIINRVIRSIRNFGIIATAKEINPQGSEAERYLRRWKIEVSEDGERWIPLMKEDLWKDLLFGLMPEISEELDASLWPDIEESIQDNIVPVPEEEFCVNTIEYLKNGNFRMALVESVMCLEIVTSQYLEKYLTVHMKTPPNRIDMLLQPQLGLSARVAALLDLCLHPDDIKKIEFKNILTAIRWRNKIMHKTGHLPKNLPEDIIRRNIVSVLKLVSLLAMRRNQIEASPEMQKTSKAISEKLKVPLPNIWVTGRHRILMEFVFFVIPSNIPTPEVLDAISKEAIRLLSERDTRFKPEEHLYIRYFNFPRELLARWYKGTLHLVPSTKKETSY